MKSRDMKPFAATLGLHVGAGPMGESPRRYRVWPGTELRDWHEGGHLYTTTGGWTKVVAFLRGYEAGRAAR